MVNNTSLDNIKSKLLNSPYRAFLSKEEMILLMLLDIRCVNSRQIMDFFEYKSTQAAKYLLDKLCEEGKIKQFSADKRSSLGTIYQLTNLGSEEALMLKDMPLAVNNEEGVLVKNYRTESENRLSKKVIPHAISINEYYFALLKSNNVSNFEWYEERESSLKDSNENILLRPDASFLINGKHLFFLEQDMGTEGKRRFMQKFSNYNRSLENVEKLPSLLISIDLNRTLGVNILSQIKKQAQKYEDEIKELKGKIRTIENIMKINLKSYDKEVIEKEKKSIREALNSNFLNKREKERLTNTLSILENYDEHTFKEYEILKKRYEELQKRVNEEELKIKKDVLDRKYKIRIENIRAFVYGIEDNAGLTPIITKRGLDVFVNRSENLQEYIINYVATNNTGKDKLTRLLEEVKQAYANIGYQTNLSVIDKYKFYYKHKTYICDRLVKIQRNEEFDSYYLYDLSFNNIGAEYRFINICNEIDNAFDGDIYCITDNPEKSLFVDSKINNPLVKDKITYIDIATFDETDSTMYNIKERKILPLSKD